MKVRFAVLAAALVVAVSAMPALAQQPGPPPGGMGGPGGGRRMAALLNGITLTAEQQARVDSIVASVRAQMPPFTPGQAPDPGAMQQRRALSMRQDSLVRVILTSEQQVIWDRNLQNMPQFPGRPPGR